MTGTNVELIDSDPINFLTSKAFWINIDLAWISISTCPFQITGTSEAYLLVLIGGDSDELGFFEDIRPKSGIWQFQNVVCTDKMEPGLVLVHRIENGL